MGRLINNCASVIFRDLASSLNLHFALRPSFELACHRWSLGMCLCELLRLYHIAWSYQRIALWSLLTLPSAHYIGGERNWFKGVTFTFWIKIDRKNIFPKINSKIYLFSGSFPARSSDTGTAGTGIEILGSLSARPLPLYQYHNLQIKSIYSKLTSFFFRQYKHAHLYTFWVGGEQRRNQEFRFRFRQCRYRNFWQEKTGKFVNLWIDFREDIFPVYFYSESDLCPMSKTKEHHVAT